MQMLAEYHIVKKQRGGPRSRKGWPLQIPETPEPYAAPPGARGRPTLQRAHSKGRKLRPLAAGAVSPGAGDLAPQACKVKKVPVDAGRESEE